MVQRDAPYAAKILEQHRVSAVERKTAAAVLPLARESVCFRFQYGVLSARKTRPDHFQLPVLAEQKGSVRNAALSPRASLESVHGGIVPRLKQDKRFARGRF